MKMSEDMRQFDKIVITLDCGVYDTTVARLISELESFVDEKRWCWSRIHPCEAQK